jgi:hypothetical protein
MVKTVIAHSKVSSSKVSTERKIEDFSGNHSASDITPVPLDLDVSQTKRINKMVVANPSIIEDAPVLGQIEIATPPPTRIPNIIEDETQRKIKNFQKGRK